MNPDISIGKPQFHSDTYYYKKYHCDHVCGLLPVKRTLNAPQLTHIEPHAVHFHKTKKMLPSQLPGFTVRYKGILSVHFAEIFATLPRSY